MHKYTDLDLHTTPRKGYKTITVDIKTFLRFAKAVNKACEKDPKSTNSVFLNLLLDLHM